MSLKSSRFYFWRVALSSLRRRLQQLCVCSSSWVHKMNGVIDCLVCHPCCLSNSSVGRPFITEHYTARTNILLDEMEVCGSISVPRSNLLLFIRSPPKHQVTSNYLPRLYFLFPNLLSSISTSTPGPPMMDG